MQVSSSIIQLNKKGVSYLVRHTHQHPPFSFAACDYEIAEENVNAENNECITNHKLEQSLE